MKRRKLCKLAEKKLPDQDLQVNPPITSTDVKLQDVDKYNPVWPVDPKLWKEYLTWKRSKKTTHEERIVVYTTRKKEFFKKLEENTWILGDVRTLSKFHFTYKNYTIEYNIFI